MKIELSNLKIRLLSYSLVAVWQNPIANIPPFDQTFAKYLFDSKEPADYNSTSQGLIIQVKNLVLPGMTEIRQKPFLLLGYTQLIYLHDDENGFFEKYQIILDEINKDFSLRTSLLRISQLGINIEYEIQFDENVNAKDFLRQQFLSGRQTFKNANWDLNDVQFKIFEETPEKYLIVQIQPRITGINGIYIRINDHYGKLPSANLLSTDELKEFVKVSKNKMGEKVLNHLIHD